MSEKSLSVHYLPQWVEPEELRGATVVMIDTLRASTTIVAALANGAAAVIPLLRVEDVHARTSEWVRKQIVLGGEREGVKIDLFDLGNSPAEYSGDVVEGKTVLFTTTNGTRALEQCRQAHAVLIGALTNLSAICHAIRDTLNVQILCAGTRGEVTREDVLAAGAIVYQLTQKEPTGFRVNDSAHLARAAWRGIVARAFGAGVPIAEYLAGDLRETYGGRNMLQIGQESDLAIAAAVDTQTVVPRLDLATWQITLDPPIH